MKKIIILGVSAGVGKSTFAKKLGKSLTIPVYHLDKYYWNPGWVEAPKEEFMNAQFNIVQTEQWIIEGNYSTTYEIRANNADTIIYLELPLRICLYRVLKRWIMNLGKNREDMGQGCPEKMDRKFLAFIFKTYHQRKNSMKKRITTFEHSRDGRKTYRLTTKKEIYNFLDNL